MSAAKWASSLRASTLVRSCRKAGAAAAILGAAILAIGSINPNAIVESRFAAAIADVESDLTLIAVAKPAVTVVGSEEFWLGEGSASQNRDAFVHRTAWRPPVQKGDRFTVSAGDDSRLLEVVDVREISGRVITAAFQMSEPRHEPQLLVTCRDVADPSRGVVHFVIDGHGTLPWSQTDQAGRA